MSLDLSLEPPLVTSFFPASGERRVVVGFRACPPCAGVPSRGEQTRREEKLPLHAGFAPHSRAALFWRFHRASADLSGAREQALRGLRSLAPGSRACVQYRSDAESGQFVMTAAEWVLGSSRRAYRLGTMAQAISSVHELDNVTSPPSVVQEARRTPRRRGSPSDYSIDSDSWEESWDFLGSAWIQLLVARHLGVPLEVRRRAAATVLLFAARHRGLPRGTAMALRAVSEAVLHGLGTDQRARLLRSLAMLGYHSGLIAAKMLLVRVERGTERLENALFWIDVLLAEQDALGFSAEDVLERIDPLGRLTTLNDAQAFASRLVTSMIPGYLLPLFAADAGLLPEAR